MRLACIGPEELLAPFSLLGALLFREEEADFGRIEKEEVGYLVVSERAHEKYSSEIGDFQARRPDAILLILPGQSENKDGRFKYLRDLTRKSIGVDLWKEKE